MCYKIASNFIPNKEGLFYMFCLFPTCSIQVHNGFPLITPFFMRGSHKMVTKRILMARSRGGTKKGNKWKVGRSEKHCGNRKVFSRHIGMAIKFFSFTIAGFQ